MSEIDANRPAIAGISWNNGTGHMVVLRGYDDSTSTKYVSYMEPGDGFYYSMTYNAFVGSSSGTRHWIETVYNIKR
ncbi:hypothetical protein [Alkaliphilus hydrothermalis]|uniref:Peptidase C39-like domain-containing protein n=1 Tax=Alkaliphilus hydrothermalis TaxID=1482730 RepID=A0ABS2NTQ0_9FIRM|nr:hypothetical protein [Alkaliphilus hydrothermalis]